MAGSENLANKILFEYLNRGQSAPLSADFETYVKDGYSGNVNIYSIIRKIITPAIGVRWEVKENGEVVEGENPISRLMTKPNERQSFANFIDEALTWLLLTGNRYTYVLRVETGANKGLPVELHLLPASQVEIVAGTWLQPVQGYKVKYNYSTKDIPPENIIHNRLSNPNYDASGSQLYGLSPLQSALKVMTATNAAYDTMSKQFSSGGPDVIITNTAATSQQEWTEEQFQTVWQRFKAKFRTGSKERFMLKNLPVEVHEIGKSLVDLNILEFIKLSLRDYCNIYGIPSALMNDNEYATQSANAREYQRQLWNNAVIPQLEFLKDDLNRVASMVNQVTGSAYEVDYNLSDIPELQADIATQAAALAQSWWMTANERRSALGLPPLEEEEANVILAPTGLMPLSGVDLQNYNGDGY